MKNMITIDSPYTAVEEGAKVGEVGLKSVLLNEGEKIALITSGLKEEATFTAHTLKGQLLLSEKIPASLDNCEIVSSSELPAGTYIYSIESSTQKFFGKFIVK